MTTTIYVYDNGDPSVGIPPNEMTFTLNWDMDAIDAEERKTLKDAFKRFAREWLDFGYPRVYAHFADECPDCEHRFEKDRCMNKDCISYNPDAQIEVIKEDENRL